MAPNIDQVPQYSNPQPTPNNQPPVHPERVQVGFYETPVPGGPFQRDKINNVDVAKNKRNALRITGLVAIGAVGLAAAGFGYMKFNDNASEVAGKQVANYLLSDPENPSNGVDIDNGTVTIETPSNNSVDLNSVSAEEFIDSPYISRNEQVQYALDKLEKMEDDSIEALRSMGYDIDIGSGGESDSAQQILDRWAVNSYAAWKVGQDNPDEAKKLIAGFVDPESKQYDISTNIATNGGAAYNNTSIVLDESQIFKQSQFQNIEPNGNATKVITLQTNLKENLNQAVFQQVEGTDGSSSSWVLKQLISAGNEENEAVITNPYFLQDIMAEIGNYK